VAQLKRIVCLIILFALASLLTCLDVKADAGEERTVYLSATEYDYPPFSVTDTGEADGFSVDLLKAVALEMGIVVTFKIDQWSVLKEELKNGELDILPLVGYTEERDEVYDFTVPYIVMRGNIFVREGDSRIKSQDDLFGKEILVLEGDNSQEWAWSIGLDSELTATTTYLEAFQLLASGQYDAVLAQGLVGEKLVSDHALDNVTPVYVYDDNGVNRYKLSLEGYEQKFCFAVVEGDSELLSILNEGLSIVSANGVYDALYQKWFPFLLEPEGVSALEVIRYVLYALVPVLVLLVAAYFVTTRRTIRIRTQEIMEEKERSEKYLHDLLLSGRIFESSIENAPIPIMIHAEDGTVLNISRTWTRLTGYTIEDIPTIYDWTEKAYGSKRDEVRAFISKLYTLSETQHDGDFHVLTKDGQTRIWDFHSMHIGDLPDGRAVSMSVATDMTERVLLDRKLKESEQRFKVLHNASFGGIALHDKGRILECNQGLADITGYSIGELIGTDGLLLIAPECREHVMERILSGYEKPYEVSGIRRNGEIYPLKLEARNIPYEGKTVRVVEFRDVTDIKKQADEKEKLEKQWGKLIEKMPLGFCLRELIIDEHGKPVDYRFLSANENYETITGLKRDEVIGKTALEIIPDIEPSWIDKYADVVTNGKTSVIEDYSRALGKYFRVVTYPHRDNEFVVIADDITERRNNQERLVESEENYRLLTSQMPLGLAVHEVITDERGEPVDFRFISMNDSWETVMGVKKETVLGKTVMEVFPETETYWIEAFGKVAITGKPFEFENYAKELGRFLKCVIYSPKPRVFAVIVEDVTDEKRNEEEKEYLRTHDLLTGLSNRVSFDQQIKALDRPKHLPISMTNFDINGLIIINEAFGHETGDDYIRFVSRTLEDVYDDHSVISRVGGDQFTVIATNTSKDDALKKAREAADLVKAYDVNGIQLSMSYGIATKVADEDINTLFLTSENNMYSNKIFESQSYRNNSIKSMIKAYHEKNPREEEHSRRVAVLCEQFGIALGMGDDDINKLKAISHLHDIGKIAIDEAILNKPGELTDDEWEIIKKHPEIGARIISTSDEYAVIADDILSHHERYDGKGYPFGIKGQDIPVRARMISIIDSFDAMTSDRPYRKAMTRQDAIGEIHRCAGTQFDPELADIFVRQVLNIEN
jgi:diguanylate cyclase